MIIDYEIAIRLMSTVVVGIAVGFARRHQSAGIRTFALISLGSGIFTIMSINPEVTGGDSVRIIANIVTGIGFLGVGVIWKHGDKPSGITTAAAIWVTAGLGVLAGMGFWFEAMLGTILTMAILYSKGPLKKAAIE